MTAPVQETTNHTGELATALFKIEQLQESIQDLQREDRGWKQLTIQGERDMSREGIIAHAEQHRVMAIANPLIRRGLHLVAAYVFGQGVGTSTDDDDTNAVVQHWLDDPSVRKVFSGAQAQERNQIALGTDGNLFFALPTNPMSGEVTIRDIPMEEITGMITAPGDRETVQFYVRQWSEWVPEAGRTMVRKAAYPALRHAPRTRHRRVTVGPNETAPVQWDTPVYHVAVNQLKGQQWGTADAFSAVGWARMYSEFLHDWHRLVKALSRIAWKATGKNASQSQQMRAQMAGLDANGAGGSAVLTGDTDLVPMPKTGATIDSESARPIATMVAAALGLPVTTLMSDPGQTGARAVAETLNLPTRLIMEAKQEVWREARRQILEYVMLQAAAAPQGRLRQHRRHVVQVGDHRRVEWPGGEGTLTIAFPPLDDTPVETLTQAIAQADATEKMPPETTMRLLLRALRVRDVDEILSRFTDDAGNFIHPQATVEQAEGAAAMRAARAGRSGNLNQRE